MAVGVLNKMKSRLTSKLKNMSKLDKKKAIDPFVDYKLNKKMFHPKLCEKRWDREKKKKVTKHYNQYYLDQEHWAKKRTKFGRKNHQYRQYKKSKIFKDFDLFTINLSRYQILL